MRRRAFLRGAAAVAVVGAAGRVRQGLGQSRGRELPPGFALLRATQGEIVLPRQTVKVELDAAYPGYWMIHCHLLSIY
jgi:hypothetical protein